MVFTEAAESQFIDKLMIVTHRDFKGWLDFFDRFDHEGELVDNLPDLAAMVRGAPGVFVYPLLCFVLTRTVSGYAVSGEWLEQDLTVRAAMAVKSTSVDAVQILAPKYVRAFRVMVRTSIDECLPPSDLLMEVTSVDISAVYLPHGEKAGEFFQPVEFEIRVRFGEK